MTISTNKMGQSFTVALMNYWCLLDDVDRTDIVLAPFTEMKKLSRKKLVKPNSTRYSTQLATQTATEAFGPD